MIMNWLLTILLSIFAYTLYSYYGMRTAGATTATAAAFEMVRSWMSFGLIFMGTIGFSLALFYGSKASEFAVTVVIAIGVVVSFAFSAIVGGGLVGMGNLVGLALILGGIYLLK